MRTGTKDEIRDTMVRCMEHNMNARKRMVSEEDLDIYVPEGREKTFYEGQVSILELAISWMKDAQNSKDPTAMNLAIAKLREVQSRAANNWID